MLAEVAELLACPVCRSDLELEQSVLLCSRGHSFDVARQGYVSLVTGAATKFTGDTADMVAARAEFLDAGHFDDIARTVADIVGEPIGDRASRIVEIGAGTGYYLARAVDRSDDALGLGIDISKAAARRAARAHPRVAAVVADAWQALPILDGAVTHALSIFSPRNPDEVSRVLCSDGLYIVATPTSRHLCELVAPIGMVRVDEEKTRRLGESMSAGFERIDRVPVEYAVELDHAAVGAVVGMGPSAHHLSPQVRAEAIAALPAVVSVTVSVVVSAYRPRLAITSA